MFGDITRSLVINVQCPTYLSDANLLAALQSQQSVVNVTQVQSTNGGYLVTGTTTADNTSVTNAIANVINFNNSAGGVGAATGVTIQDLTTTGGTAVAAPSTGLFGMSNNTLLLLGGAAVIAFFVFSKD